MKKYFGTDGIRGRANQFPMQADLALKLGMAAGIQFKRGGHRHRVVISKDTRLSGYMIEPALTAGFVSVGMDVFLLGPLPTPAVSMLTRSMRADIGVMISASHNVYQDNGIKLFDYRGLKLGDEIEAKIEDLLDQDLNKYLVDSADLGRVQRLDDAAGRYVQFVKGSFPKNQTLDGLKIVIDCANGASYRIAPTILWELGAEIIPIGVEPNGCNINADCGSTKPEKLIKNVLENKADIGIALDGDADRLIISDEKGNLIDGDKIIGAIATHLQQNGQLKSNSIVTTQMSNLGLENYIKSLGLDFKRAQIGDRYVAEQMQQDQCNFGGEQSGHIIMRDYCATGDGLIAALQILSIMQSKGQKVSEITNLFEIVPQILRNLRYNPKNGDPLEKKEVQDIIAKAQKELEQKNGRILVRKSGTEPLIRIMVEGEDKDFVEKMVDDLEKDIAGIGII